MKKEFVPYKIALALKELGFDEPCFMYEYTGDTGNNVNHTLQTLPSLAKNHNQDMLCVSIPLYQQAFRWFREKYGLHQVILADEKGKYDIIVSKKISGACLGQYLTYEEAELECLKKLIELCKKN